MLDLYGRKRLANLGGNTLELDNTLATIMPPEKPKVSALSPLLPQARHVLRRQARLQIGFLDAPDKLEHLRPGGVLRAAELRIVEDQIHLETLGLQFRTELQTLPPAVTNIKLSNRNLVLGGPRQSSQ